MLSATAAGEVTPIVTGAIGEAVPAGTYDLSATTIPGYDASNWTCTGGTVDGNVVTVPEGLDVVCVVTHDDRPVDLQLTKSDAGATAVAGGSTFDYTLTINNLGTRDADLGEQVLVTDVLPAGLVFATVPTNCSIGGQAVTCLLDPADLEASDPAIVLTITVRAAADAASATYTNMANPLMNDRSWNQAAKDPGWGAPDPVTRAAPIDDGPISPWNLNRMTVAGTMTAAGVLMVLLIAAGSVGWAMNDVYTIPASM